MAEAPSTNPDAAEHPEITESAERREFKLDFYQRTMPVLPELYWIGTAIQEGRFDELVGEFEPLTGAQKEGAEHIYGTSDHATVLEEIRERYIRLAEQAQWDPDIFLDTLAGLPRRPEDKLPESPLPSPDFHALQRSQEYLKFLERQLELLEVTFDRRRLIQLLPEMLHWAEGHVEPLYQAMNTYEPSTYNDGLRAFDYLALGELDRVRKTVKTMFQGVGITMLRNPFYPGPGRHLSSSRLEMLQKGQIDLIGEQTAERMREHIKDCQGCGENWAHTMETARTKPLPDDYADEE